MAKIHELKTWPDFFFRVFSGQKKFEVRKSDRDFQIGDTLKLMEFDLASQKYTDRAVRATVDYILHGGQFGIEEGYCVMSITVFG